LWLGIFEAKFKDGPVVREFAASTAPTQTLSIQRLDFPAKHRNPGRPLLNGCEVPVGGRNCSFALKANLSMGIILSKPTKEKGAQGQSKKRHIGECAHNMETNMEEPPDGDRDKSKPSEPIPKSSNRPKGIRVDVRGFIPAHDLPVNATETSFSSNRGSCGHKKQANNCANLSCEAPEVAQALGDFRLCYQNFEKCIHQRGIDDEKLLSAIKQADKVMNLRDAAKVFRIAITQVAKSVIEQGRFDDEKRIGKVCIFLSKIYPLVRTILQLTSAIGEVINTSYHRLIYIGCRILASQRSG
jgi:hypothetical protein